MKKIDTLIDDIESVIYGLGGWTRSIALNLGQNIGISATKDLVSHKNLVGIYLFRLLVHPVNVNFGTK